MTGQERYQAFDPPLTLRPWIRTIWTYAAPPGPIGVERIAPDGCPELVFDIGAATEEQGEDGVYRPQPTALFAGQMTRPMALRPMGGLELLGVRFHPDGARDWLARPLTAATDRRLDVVERCRALSLPAGDPENQARRVIDWLETERQAGDWRLDAVVRAEVQAMESGQPTPERDAAGRRALQRRFLDRVGVSPRTLRSILRFRRVFDHALAPDGLPWLQAGLEAGYFDQPQLARDFRRFLGCTATQWAREQMALARAVASQTYKPAGPVSD